MPGHPGAHDLALALEVGVVDVQVEAAALQGLGELPGVVGGEEDHRQAGGPDRAQLGDRDLVLGEHLEQQRLGLELDPVDLVDQQHHRLVGPDGLEQRAGQEEVLGEDVLLELLPGGRPGRRRVGPGARRSPGRPGCAAAACGSSTRRGPWTRRGPRSTGGGSAGCRSARPPTWPAGSCRSRPAPPPAPAWPAGRPGRPRRRSPRRPGSRRRPAPGAPRHRVEAGRPGVGEAEGRLLAGCVVVGRGHRRTCPSPRTTHLTQVSSRSPIGPRAWSFWVEMPDLGPEAELAAVDEPGRGVDHHRRRVHLAHEPLGGGQVGGHDGLGVARAEAGDVVDGRRRGRRPRPR